MPGVARVLVGSLLQVVTVAPLIQALDAHCIGSLSEVFDEDPPPTPRGCIAQAWTVAEVLKLWEERLWTLRQP